MLGEIPLTAVGPALGAGDKAPQFTLSGKGFLPEPVTLWDFSGKALILSCVPSLDTSVCDRETRRWDEEVKALGGKLAMLTVSMDLPFTQARWCGANGVEHKTASAHNHNDFGEAYGVLIQENGLLGRAVFVIDKEGQIIHSEYCPKIGDEPHYEEILAKAVAAAG